MKKILQKFEILVIYLEMEYIITLQSNINSKINQNNTIAYFITPLNHRLFLEGNWVVGISEIQYTKSWYNILNSTEIKLYYENGQEFELKNLSLSVSEGHYESEEQLIGAINTELIKLSSVLNTPPGIKYNSLNKKVYIEPGLTTNGVKLSPNFGEEIDSILGFKIDASNYYRTETISVEDSNFLSLRKAFSAGVEPSNPVEISRGYHSLYIYSNIVHPSFIGDSFSQILRVVEVPSEKKFGENIVIRYENPQYRKVLFNEIQIIEINIKDDTNELIPFKFGRVRIDLHLKKL
jgi:hypothetical protein